MTEYGLVIVLDADGDPILTADGSYIYLWAIPAFCEGTGSDEDICSLVRVGVDEDLGSLVRVGTDEDICDPGDRT